MSLVITFNGKNEVYIPKPSPKSYKLSRLSKLTPTFNDLIHQYLDKETIERHKVASQKSGKKSLNQKINAYQNHKSNFKKKIFYARDLMSTHVKTITSSETINDALQMLGEFQFHHIPIIEDKKLHGIISDRLILKSLANAHQMNTPLKNIMIKKVLTAKPESSIPDIARAMLAEKISCLPIIDDEIRLKGIITTSDILNFLTLSFPFEVYS